MRIKQLDILRFIAIALVLARHGGVVPVLTRIGWVGVDLFFVLSGFLISGLLYSEYKKHHSISFKRFFIRRGLKIYPAFYVMIIVSLLARKFLSQAVPSGSIFSELFFLQNYRLGIWPHTWSLGVEEQFYIFLPVFLLILIRLSRNRPNPFARVPAAFCVIAMVCLLLRIATILFTPKATFTVPMVLNPTHERMDSLFFGVTIGYFYHYKPQIIDRLFDSRLKRILIVLLSLGLTTPCFLDQHSWFLLTIGLSFIYIGFGGLLLVSLRIRNVLPRSLSAVAGFIGTICAFIGAYSYSIYLWHIPFAAFAFGVVRRILHIQFDPALHFSFYVVGSLIFGIFMAKLIEFPVLKIRDRLFPSRQGPILGSNMPQPHALRAIASEQN